MVSDSAQTLDTPNGATYLSVLATFIEDIKDEEEMTLFFVVNFK